MEQVEDGAMGDVRATRRLKPTPFQTIAILMALVPIIAGYIFLGLVFHNEQVFMGFLFATYWGSVKKLVMSEFLPTLIGGLGGIGLAYLFYALPLIGGPAFGMAGLFVLLLVLYFKIRGELTILCNPPFLIFLTVATIPLLAEKHDYVGMVIGTGLGAVYSLIVFLVVTNVFKAIKRRGGRRVAPVARRAGTSAV